MGGPAPPHLASLRVATMGRTGSPLSPQPSTPGSTSGPGGGGGGAGSLPHTPTAAGCSSLKPRPPGERGRAGGVACWGGGVGWGVGRDGACVVLCGRLCANVPALEGWQEARGCLSGGCPMS